MPAGHCLRRSERRYEVNSMIERTSEKSRGRYFIRVLLSSGTRFNPMGNEELAIFCHSENEEPSIVDVDKERLIRWVNSNPTCKRNQSNEQYRISRQENSMSVIFLSDREIQACRSANRIFPC
jgi:hypothetical protein